MSQFRFPILNGGGAARPAKQETGKQYWRSLDEIQDTPEFRDWVEREFPENASLLQDPSSRRTILKLMAASFGLAGLTACRRPVEKIMPVAKGVEDYIPGKPLYYATAMTLNGAATGLVVECHDGRPTKIEGNPKHPSSGGAASAYAQASLLGLYDPDRSRAIVSNGDKADWDRFTSFANSTFTGDGEGLWFLSERIASPSLEAVKAHAMRKFPKAKWAEYEPISEDEAIDGAILAFGEALRPQYRFEKADVVVALDSDFLGVDGAVTTWTRDFARRRKAEAMNRLYAVESNYSITGAMADHRQRLRTSEVRQFAADLAKELGATGGGLKVLGGADKWVAAVAKDLAAHRGRSLVIAGPRQPAVVHALAHVINQHLGNAGETVVYTKTPQRNELMGIARLAEEMAGGGVKALVILGGNPAYNAPADLDFEAKLKRIPASVHVGLEYNETAAASKWHIPEAHYLESWSDALAWDGTASVQQPMIEPLFGGRTQAEVLALISGYKDQRPYDIVRNYWMAQWPQADREARWRRSLHDGIISVAPAAEPVKALADAKRVSAELAQSKPAYGGIEVVFYQDASLHDGRFANNGWLQEAPDPMTKLTWDNAALLSPATAKSLGVKTGDVISISRAGREISAPAMVQPGHADNSISLALGYGRRRVGRVGRGAGFDAYRIRTSDGFWIAAGAQVRKTGARYAFSLTQDHHSMEGRPVVREATLEEFRKKPGFAREMVEHPPLESLYPEHAYDKGYQWGMAIDLNACTGCNACVLACQAENNIPIVGKDQVARGREMHWIRMDRYFTGNEADPQVVYQPVACQQCENAPCEAVCPVAATSHSPEGLNDMAYNRCVGTRYCANNCPYKVRRFNFLEWNKDVDELHKMAFNPDVSVRVRGVMEKCTYCVQRIQEKKIQAKAEGRRPIRDGEIKTACQQTCPAEAIVFGNINDPESRVAKLHKQDRSYALLEELNVKPRTQYLGKLRNPNPELVA